MACKLSLMLLNKINILLLALIYHRKKHMKQQRKRKMCRFGNYLQKEELKVNLTFLYSHLG